MNIREVFRNAKSAMKWSEDDGRRNIYFLVWTTFLGIFCLKYFSNAVIYLLSTIAGYIDFGTEFIIFSITIYLLTAFLLLLVALRRRFKAILFSPFATLPLLFLIAVVSDLRFVATSYPLGITIRMMTFLLILLFCVNLIEHTRRAEPGFYARLKRIFDKFVVFYNRRIFTWLFLTVVLGVLVFEAHVKARLFGGPSFDGPFQLYNALRRFDAGQLPGRDFQFFHGIGTLLVHYPIYFLAGRDLYASELSRRLISPILTLLISTVVFSYLGFRLSRALRAAGVFLLSVFSLHHYFYAVPALPIAVRFALRQVQFFFEPGGSIISVRSAFPLLAGILALYPLRRRRETASCGFHRWSAILIAAPLLAWSFIVSTEQGMAAFLAFFLVLPISFLVHRERWFNWLLKPVAATLLFLALALLFLHFTTGGHALDNLHYALVDIPADQFWYFGFYPNDFLFLFGDGGFSPPLIELVFVLYIVLFSLLIISYSALKLKRWSKLNGLGDFILYGIAYGLLSLVSMLGMVTFHYLTPLLRVTCWVIAAVLVVWCRANPRHKRTIKAVEVLGVVFLLLFFFIKIEQNDFKHRHSLSFARQIVSGVRLNQNEYVSLQQALATIQADPGDDPQAVLWSTYAGIMEDQLGIFPPANDYIIHALGPKMRDAYLETFIRLKPKYVYLVRRDAFNYEEWLQMTSWEFYEYVALNYQVMQVTRERLLLKRKGDWQPLATLDQTPRYWPDLDCYQLPGGAGQGVAVVEVTYRTHMALAKLPLLGKASRFVATPLGGSNKYPISLPYYRQTFRFPVYLKDGFVPFVRFTTMSPAPGATLEIDEIHYGFLPRIDFLEKTRPRIRSRN